MEQEKKGGGLAKKVIIFILIVAILAIGYFAYSSGVLSDLKGGDVTTVSKATLEDVIEISELPSVEYTYNAVKPVYATDGKTLKYYVAYEGTVKAGIDFEAIEIAVDEEQKTINIIIPEVKILDCNVDDGTLEYIFTDDKYDDATVSSEASKECIKDLEYKVSQEPKLLAMAQENAKLAIEGLVEPWVEQIDNEYTINVK